MEQMVEQQQYEGGGLMSSESALVFGGEGGGGTALSAPRFSNGGHQHGGNFHHNNRNNHHHNGGGGGRGRGGGHYGRGGGGYGGRGRGGGRGGRGGDGKPRIPGSMVPRKIAEVLPRVKVARDILTRLGDYSANTAEDDIVSSIRVLCGIFAGLEDLSTLAEEISQIFLQCLCTLSMQTAIFSTLLAMLNLKHPEFVSLVVQKIEKRLVGFFASSFFFHFPVNLYSI